MFTKANKIILTAVMCFLVCVSATKVFANFYYVDVSPNCDESDGVPAYCLIQSAVNHTTTGDIVSIAAGTYIENITVAQSITINGVSDGSTIIEGIAATTPVFLLGTADTTVNINNLTIKNGTDSGIKTESDSITLELQNVVLQNNTASYGGGINFGSNTSSVLTISNSLITGNTATYGGGTYVKYPSSVVDIVNTTLSANNATDGGAAIKNSGAATFINTTITNNNSDSDAGGTSDGGAIYNTGSGSLTIKNSILYGNSGLTASFSDCTGSITAQDYNVVGNNVSCTFSGDTANIISDDPILSDLVDNGSQTTTHALLFGSPAIDAIPIASCTLTEDQRGFARPVDGNGDGTAACDIGAYEVGTCGDGHMEMSEACDDGNTERGDDCTDVCMIEVCGNGIFDDGEECDDSNLDNNDGCSLICQIEHCGDNITQADEECDDGNVIAGDGCSSLCNNEICGNDVVNAGEECDDGNVIDSDGCSSTCQVESCGDGITQTSEQCDDGNDVETDNCKSSCVISICGDRILDTGEECDDGNTTDNDGCSATCAYEDDQDQDADEDVDQDQDVDEDDTDASTGTSTTDGEVASGSGGDGGGCSLIATAIPMNGSTLLFVGILVGLAGLRRKIDL